MTRARIPGIFTLPLLLMGPLLKAQEQMPRILYQAKVSVMKVEIRLVDSGDSERVTDQLKLCFAESDYCVIGTGVRLNDDGDVLTAAHVVRDTSVVIQTLRDMGIDSEVMVAGQARNAEYVKTSLGGVNGAFKAATRAMDPEHDIAVLHLDRNGPKPGFDGIEGHASSRRGGAGSAAMLDVERPNAGEAVFAFGFPMYSAALITSQGSITLAFGSKNLMEARKSGDGELVPVYRAGLTISPGNGGGALFRASDGALLGIVAEIGNERDPIATIVPAAEIARFLTANAIRWTGAPRIASGKNGKASRKKSR